MKNIIFVRCTKYLCFVEFVDVHGNKVAEFRSNCCPRLFKVVSVVSKNDLRSQFYFHSILFQTLLRWVFL